MVSTAMGGNNRQFSPTLSASQSSATPWMLFQKKWGKSTKSASMHGTWNEGWSNRSANNFAKNVTRA
jgi:hypothetical protein